MNVATTWSQKGWYLLQLDAKSVHSLDEVKVKMPLKDLAFEQVVGLLETSS